MTRFERDMKEIGEGNGIEVMKRRKNEIAALETEGKCCRNSFRRTCIAQEIARITKEYNKLDEFF